MIAKIELNDNPIHIRESKTIIEFGVNNFEIKKLLTGEDKYHSTMLFSFEEWKKYDKIIRTMME